MNKLLKSLIIILLALPVGSSVYAQEPAINIGSKTGAVKNLGRFYVDSMGYVPSLVRLPGVGDPLLPKRIGGLIVAKIGADTSLYYWTQQWNKVASQNWVNNQGYLTSYTETDPTVGSHIKSITTTNIGNWNTAYGWGNHASAGYLTTVPSLQEVTDIGKVTTNYIQVKNSGGYLLSSDVGITAAQLSYDDIGAGVLRGKLSLFNGSGVYGTFLPAGLTTVRTYTMPDASGTLALQEWVTAQGYLTSVSTPTLDQVMAAGSTLTANRSIIVPSANTFEINQSNNFSGYFSSNTLVSLSKTTTSGFNDYSQVNLRNDGMNIVAEATGSNWHKLELYPGSFEFKSMVGGVASSDVVFKAKLPSATTGNVVYYNTTTNQFTQGVAPSGNPMTYPSAGVAVSTGTAWETSPQGTANQVFRRNAGNTAYEFYTLPSYLTSETDPLYTANGVPNTRTLTINGTALDLSANRSWSVGTVTSVGLTSTDITVGGTSPITGSGTYTLTLPTVNSNVGTFNNITIDAKGRATAGSNVSYLTSYTETDPIVRAINGIIKSNGTTISAAVAGTDYLTPTGSAAALTNFPTFNQNTTGTAANVTGTVAVGNGGTGTTTLTGVVIGTGTTAMTAVAGTGSQLLRRNAGNTAYEFFTPTYLTAETDPKRVTSLAFSGTTIKTLTLTLADATTVSNTFTDLDTNTPANLALGTATASTLPITNSNGTGFTLPTFGTTAGLVPGTATGTTLFLRQDGTWQAPSGTGANSLGTYIVQTATNAPANAQILGSLGTGIVKNTTTTGVLSIAVAGDFPTLNQNTTGTAASVSGTNVITAANQTQMAANTVKGNNTAGLSNELDLTTAQVKTMLALNNVENTALSTWAGSTNITTLGTIATGTWNATAIGISKGGTGQTALGTGLQVLRTNSGATATEWATLTDVGFANPMTTLGDIIYGGASGVPTRLGGSAGFLKSTGAAAPTFSALASADIPNNAANTTGSAATLTTGRTIAMTGDVAYTSGSFNGSANVTGTATLATVNTNVGTFNNVTVNGKGLVTAASNVAYITAANLALGTATVSTQPITNSGGTGFTLPTFGTNAGLVPGTATGTTLFLRQDGTWQAPTTATPNLQAVTNVGSSTTTNISSGGYTWGNGTVTTGTMGNQGTGSTANGIIDLRASNGNNGQIVPPANFSLTRTFTLPDASGTFALTSQITGTNSGTNTGDQNIFSSIPVSGQTTVTASNTATALTFIAGTNTTITTDNAAKSITFNSTAMSNPMTTVGDLILGGTSGAPTRLAKGANNTILSTDNSGNVGWVNGAPWSGAYATSTTFTGSTGLGNANIPLHVFTGTVASTFTLPDRTAAANRALHVKNAGTANLTVSRAGTDEIWRDGAVTSFVLAPGQSVSVNSIGGYWNTFFDGFGTGVSTNLALGTATASTLPITNSNGTGFILPTFSTTAGLTPGTTSNTTNFLRADGTWAVPPGGGGSSNWSRSGTILSTLVASDAVRLTAPDADHIFQYYEGDTYNVGNSIGRFTNSIGRFDVNGVGIRHNVVWNFAGYNTNPGGGQEIAGEASYRFAGETFYDIAGAKYMEFHLPEMYTDGGMNLRPLSLYIPRATGAGYMNMQIEQANFKTYNNSNEDWAILKRVANNSVFELRARGATGTAEMYFYGKNTTINNTGLISNDGTGMVFSNTGSDAYFRFNRLIHFDESVDGYIYGSFSNNKMLRLRGGSQGSNVELYGNSHATLPNALRIYTGLYDGGNITLGAQNQNIITINTAGGSESITFNTLTGATTDMVTISSTGVIGRQAIPSGGGGSTNWARSGTTLTTAVAGDKLRLGTTGTADAYVHNAIAENTWASIVQPSNYGTTYTYSHGGLTGTTADRFYSGGYSLNTAANSSYDNRPNVVGIPWAYNATPSGGRLNATDGQFSFRTESHYFINGANEPHFEFHVPEIIQYDGTIRRTKSIYANKYTGKTFEENKMEIVTWASNNAGNGTDNVYASLEAINSAPYGRFTLSGTTAAGYGGILNFSHGTNGASGIYGSGAGGGFLSGTTGVGGWDATGFVTENSFTAHAGNVSQGLKMKAISGEGGWFGVGSGNGWEMRFLTGAGATYDAAKVRLTITDAGITLPTLAGNGAGYLAVSNTGVVSWSAGSGGGGSAQWSTSGNDIENTNTGLVMIDNGVKFRNVDLTNYMIIEPANYNPSLNQGRFAATVGVANGVNGADPRGNAVGSWFMYNTGTGGGPEIVGEASARFALETHYVLGGGAAFETHLPDMFTNGGVNVRPMSNYFIKSSGFNNWDYMTNALNYMHPTTQAGWGTFKLQGNDTKLEMLSVGLGNSELIMQGHNGGTNEFKITATGNNGTSFTSTSGLFRFGNSIQLDGINGGFYGASSGDKTLDVSNTGFLRFYGGAHTTLPGEVKLYSDRYIVGARVAIGSHYIGGLFEDNFIVDGPTRKLKAPYYGDGVVTGTATYGLAVDTDGNIVEVALGGGGYTLPIASATVLGGIKVGSGLSIDAGTGVLSATGGGGSNWTVTGSDIYRNSKVIIGGTSTSGLFGGNLTVNNSSAGVDLDLVGNGYSRLWFRDGSRALDEKNYEMLNFGGEWLLSRIDDANTARTTRFKIKTDGTVELSSLAGTGDRMVVASSTGILSTQAIPGGGGGANSLGTYIVQTSANAPANAQVLASLGTGLVKNTTTTGVLSIAVAGTDYVATETDPTLSTWAGSTNVTTLGTISAGTWNGAALTSTYLPSATVYNNQANTYTAGSKQTFAGSATTAGLGFVGITTDPSVGVTGDMWFRSDLGKISYLEGTSTRRLVEESLTATLTNKTINLTSNTLSMTTAQLNTALSDNDVATLAGTNTLTNKTIAAATNSVEGIIVNVRVITSGTTYTPTTGTTKIDIIAVGGGGGGGGVTGANTSVGAAAGGGSGGIMRKFQVPVTNTTYTIAIGTAGSAGVNTGGAGGNGGNTTITIGATTYTGAGGVGGNGQLTGTAAAVTLGGVSGTSTNGDINGGGQNGDNGFRLSGTIGISGAGGTSSFGAGGASVATAGPGLNATGYGAGGSGGLSTANTARAGGAGSAGVLIIYEYK